MTLIVVDASALGEYLLGTERSEIVRSTLEGPERPEVHTPALCDVEVVSILRRALTRGRLTPGRAADAVIDLIDMSVVRHGHLSLLGRIFALRQNFSAYDAAYVALAEELDASLLTADAPLARAVETHLDLRVIDASAPTAPPAM